MTDAALSACYAVSGHGALPVGDLPAHELTFSTLCARPGVEDAGLRLTTRDSLCPAFISRVQLQVTTGNHCMERLRSTHLWPKRSGHVADRCPVRTSIQSFPQTARTHLVVRISREPMVAH